MSQSSSNSGAVVNFDKIIISPQANGTDSVSAGTAGQYRFSTSNHSRYAVGDVLGNAKLEKGTTVVGIDSSNNLVFISKDIKTTWSSAETITINKVYSGQSGGTSAFKLIQGNGVTLTPSSDTSGAPAITITSSASGADGMGAGFQLEDDDGTELAITTSKEVKFIGDGITTNWTDTDNGTNTDPYDMTFTLDVDDLATTDIGSSTFGGTDLIAFVDVGASGNPTRKGTIAELSTLLAGAGLGHSHGIISVSADQSGQITAVGNLTSLTTAADSTIDLNGGAITVDGTTLSIDSTDTTNLTMTANASSAKAMTIDAANTGTGAASISIGTTSGTAVNIGHGTSEVTFGDNVTITGNLTVNGAQTIIDSTTVVSEDKTFILGLTGGMTDATYARSGTTVTVTSSSHGFSSNEYILVQDAGNSITDNVYQITVTNVNTFTFTSPASGTVSAGATMLHSTNNTTEAIADGAGIYAPGTSLHSLQYDSSNGWTVSDDLEIATGKHISIAGDTILNNTSLGLYGNSQLNANVLTYNTLGGTVISSSLTGVGVLASGSIASGFGTISTGSAITTTAAITGGSLVADNITIDGNAITSTNSNGDITLTPDGTGEVNIAAGNLNYASTAVTSTGAELNLLAGSSAGSIVNSKAVIYSSAGQVKANTVSVDAIAIIDTSTATGQSWTADSAETVASYAFGTFRTAKFVCQISNGTDFDVAEILVTYKGASAPANDAAVYLTSYAYIGTAASDLGSFDAVKGTTTIDLKFTPVADGTYAYDIVNTVLVK